MKALTFFFVLVSFFSCSNKDKKNSLVLFEDVVEIVGEEYQKEERLLETSYSRSCMSLTIQVDSLKNSP